MNNDYLTQLDTPLLLAVGFRYDTFGGTLWRKGNDDRDYAAIEDSKGEYLNWHSTGTLEPLGPRFRMTVYEFNKLFGKNTNGRLLTN